MAQLGSKQKRRSQIMIVLSGLLRCSRGPSTSARCLTVQQGLAPAGMAPGSLRGCVPFFNTCPSAPTCLVPLHPFPAMHSDGYKAQRGALLKALVTARQSLMGIKNTTALASTPLPMTNHPSSPRKHPEDRCNKLVKCVGLPRVLRVPGCPSKGKSRAES